MDDVKYKVDFHLGCKVEIEGGDENEEYEILFFDNKNNKLIHRGIIKSGYWTKPNIKYFVDWKVQILKNNYGIVHEEYLDLKDKEVLIEVGNKPIGDVIGWVPYAVEFAKRHSCSVVVQSPYPFLFDKSYPEITFVKMGTFEMEGSSFYATYRISSGYVGDNMNQLNEMFRRNSNMKYIPNLSIWNENETPRHPGKTSLQETASDVLGFESFKEIRPQFINPNPERPIDKKYVCISEFASGMLKEWNNQVGWKTLVSELKKLGYEVVSISKEKSELKNIIKRNGDFPLEDRAWYLHHCEFFIGVSSGLAWLAWGCNKKVVLISGITRASNEFNTDCIRIINEDVCHGCFNSEQHCDKFSYFKNDFCPENKNWICSRSISPKMVLDKIKEAQLI
jgi:ADP-heptose:LPS heptosyltransferase